MLGALKAAIRHAILVMLALPNGHDPRRYQLRSIWLPVTDDPGLAYAYTEVKTPRIVPSAKDITARRDRRQLAGVAARGRGQACGASRLPLGAWRSDLDAGAAENCRTIHNRIDRSTAAILREFLDEEMTVDPIEERAALPIRHYHAAWEATTGEAGGGRHFGKVYIDGIGMMKDGRRLRDGREKADDRKLYRDRPR